MNDAILLRLVWALVIIAAGLGLYQLVTHVVLGRARAASQSARLTSSGQPSILYFTTPDCAPCKTVQRPALQRLQQALGDRLQVVEINAYEKPDLARDWGVLSVPTTFILDAAGVPRHVNHGATPTEKLLKQLEEVL